MSTATTGRRPGHGRELVNQQLADLRKLRRRLATAVLPHELDETRRSLDAAMAAFDRHNAASHAELVVWTTRLSNDRRRHWSLEDHQMLDLVVEALQMAYPAELDGDHVAAAWRRLRANPGTWEAGPGPDNRCGICDGPIDPRYAQFLGLSNGDWAWCCTLGCLILEAQGEQDFYTDGVGPTDGGGP